MLWFVCWICKYLWMNVSSVKGPRKRPRDRRDHKAVGCDKEERNTGMVLLCTEQLLNLDTNDTAKATKRQKPEKAPPIEGDEKALKSTDLAKLKDLFGTLGDDAMELLASQGCGSNLTTLHLDRA